jgi:anti-sigma factor RsiW
MTDPNIPVTEDELHAYVDNELPAERRGDIETWLAGHPDDAERVQAWRAMADELHARYDAVADEPVPKRLEMERLVRQPRKWIYGAIAATLVAFIAGGGVGWLARGAAASPSALQTFTLDALDAHRLYVVEVRHPVEVPGSERAHLQAWLTKRCGWDVRAPELGATGLKLVGGRLLPGAGGPASFLMYETASGAASPMWSAAAAIGSD